jgi:peptidoglycan hydrolase CwlO-like protein
MTKKTKKAKGKLDAVTFFYGFGASVVLIGAMFKFVGWNYANELFITGLTIEAIVFFVSAFERSSDDKEYEWENVFPQLTSDEGGESADISSYQDAMKQFSSTILDLSEQIKGLSNSLGSIKEEMANNANATKEMRDKVSSFNQQIGEYNQYMQQINAKYKDFLAGTSK